MALQSTTFHIPVGTGSTGTALVDIFGVASAPRTVTGKVIAIDVRLTSTGDWEAKAGTGCFTCGIEYSSNAGATWRWAVHIPGDGADPESFLIGQMSKDGGLPTFGIGGGSFKDLVGSRVRLAAQTLPRSSSPGSTPTVRVGADVTVTST